ncbi:MAG: 3-phosphoshikimate 1-carboxyvinyltransferase [Bacteroidales bacterium]|nr:3-phosphoshikimate 1-carboxyvinyltransferase [Bacteroidales bacterium]
MQYILKAPTLLEGSIKLPASKSISNRALILNALSGKKQYNLLENLADCDDTDVLMKALSFQSNKMDIGAAGTAMRFLTAFLAGHEGIWEITGSQRMKNRPIKILVEALNQLGAKIEYLEKEGFPPLKIYGHQLIGGDIGIDGGISSQYLSALMMLAPTMQKGLRLTVQGELISSPYVRMTLEMMRQYGVQSEWSDKHIDIRPQPYRAIPFKVESDWSGASYWYQMLSLAKEGSILLKGLFQESMQGDSRIATWFEDLGVHTSYLEDGVKLTKTDQKIQVFQANFTDQPDLAQTVAVTCALKGIHFRLNGLQSLKIKETDRIQALINESRKIGFIFNEKEDSILEWNGECCKPNPEEAIDTYEDHRMAMAFAPAALIIGTIRINHPEVVSKSYPSYWEDLKSCGFIIEPAE